MTAAAPGRSLAVFDIDGTLLRTNRVEDACYLEAVHAVFGIDGAEADWEDYPDVTDSGLVATLVRRRAGREPSSGEMERFREAYGALLVERLEPDDGLALPGAAAFLADLESAGWCVTLATGNFEALARHKLARAGLPCRPPPLATADDARSRADIVGLAVERARRHFGVERFGHVVSVGDGPWDLATAAEMGIPFRAVGPRCVERGGEPFIEHYLDADRVLDLLESAVPP